MQKIITLIKDGKFKIICITYKKDHQNAVRWNNVFLQQSSPGEFHLPNEIKQGDICEVGHIVNQRFKGRVVKIIEKTNHRIVWEFIENFEFDLKNNTKTNFIKKQNQASLIDIRAQEIRAKRFTSETWFKQVLMDCGLTGFIWNYPIMEKFIIDFAWPLEKVGVEVDGLYHVVHNTKKSDDSRQKIIESTGWKLIRVNFPHEKDLLEKLQYLNFKIYQGRCDRISFNLKSVNTGS